MKRLGKVLLPYQRRWVYDASAMKIWLAARQIGKSFALAAEAVVEASKTRCTNLLLSSSERQSRELMRKVLSLLRILRLRHDPVLGGAEEKVEEITFPNGSRIVSLPASPDTVRGFSGNVFLDEFAFHRDSREIWRAIYPTATRGYKVRITSTPNGKQNMFYDIWEHAENFSRHRVDIHDAARDGLTMDIEGLKRAIADPDSWAQEFECQFIDEATAYVTYDMIAACEDEGAAMDLTPLAPPLDKGGNEGLAPPLDKGGNEGVYYIGVDVGRHKDLTVFWLLDKVGDVFWTRMVRVMRNAPFSAQRDFLYSLLDGSFLEGGSAGIKFPPRRCCIDSSGLGLQLAEEAEERFGPRVEAVHFTAPVKEDLAATLRRAFEDRLLRIPPDRDIRRDIHSVRKAVTPAGNVRFDAERSEGAHADRFWALALAVHAAGAKAGPVEYESVAAREVALEGARFTGRGGW
jgi:phage FluMu gp28-like protein